MRKPRRSKRPISSATRPRRTASGLSRTSVVSVGMRASGCRRVRTGFRTASSCAAAASASGASQYGHSRHSGSSGRATAPAGQLEPARAVRAGEEVGLDVAAAARAHALLAESPLHRADLELALAHVVEVLRRAQDRCTRARRRTGRRAPSTIETPTSTGSSMRRLASLYVQNTSASQSTTTKNSAEQHDRVERARVEEVGDAPERVVAVGGRGEGQTDRHSNRSFGRRGASPLDDRFRERVTDGVEDRDVSRINPRISTNTRQRLRLRRMLAGLQRGCAQALEQIQRSGDEDGASVACPFACARERDERLGLGRRIERSPPRAPRRRAPLRAPRAHGPRARWWSRRANRARARARPAWPSTGLSSCSARTPTRGRRLPKIPSSSRTSASTPSALWAPSSRISGFPGISSSRPGGTAAASAPVARSRSSSRGASHSSARRSASAASSRR